MEDDLGCKPGAESGKMLVRLWRGGQEGVKVKHSELLCPKVAVSLSYRVTFLSSYNSHQALNSL
jgi:hypothetical protein